MADRPPAGEPPARLPGRPGPRGLGQARPTPGPVPRPESGGSGLSVEMLPHTLRVAPGEVATASIKVRNAGSVIDEVTLTIRREVASWVSVSPETLHIYPGTEAEARIQAAPPRAIRPLAGLYALEIAVNSDHQPESSFVHRSSVELGAYDSLTATPVGSTYLQARREAILPIKIRSQGNRATTAYIATDEVPGAVISLSSTTVALEPGGESTVWATLRFRPKTSFQQNPFSISISSEYVQPIRIDGGLERPAPASRRNLAWLLAGAAVLAVGAVVVGSGMLAGHPEDTPLPTTGSTLIAVASASPIAGTSPAPTAAVTPPAVVGPTPAVTQAPLQTPPPPPTNPPDTPTPLAPPTTPPAVATTPPPTAPPITPSPTPQVAPTLIPPAIAWIDVGAQHYWKLQTDLTSNVFNDQGLFEPLDGGLSIDPVLRRATWFFQRRDAPAQNWIRCSGPIDGAETQLIADSMLISPGGWALTPSEITAVQQSLCGWWQPIAAQPFIPSPSVGGADSDFFNMTNNAYGVNMIWMPMSSSLPGYQLCSLEGPICTVNGLVQVAFGANGLFIFGVASGSVPCTNVAFGGDPVFGVQKACYSGAPVIGLVDVQP